MIDIVGDPEAQCPIRTHSMEMDKRTCLSEAPFSDHSDQLKIVDA